MSVVLDLDLHLIRFRQIGDGRGRRVDAALRLGLGDALHAMAAAFVLEMLEDVVAGDAEDDFLVAALLAGAEGNFLDLPALIAGIVRVHAIEVAGEDGRLVAAGAGADFQHHIAVVHGVLGQQRHADLLRQLVDTRLQRLELGFGHAAHFRIGSGVRQQRFGIRNLGPRRAIDLHRVDQRIELGELARDLDVFLGVQLAQQFGLQRGVVGKQDIEFGFG